MKYSSEQLSRISELKSLGFNLNDAIELINSESSDVVQSVVEQPVEEPKSDLYVEIESRLSDISELVSKLKKKL